MLKTVASEGTGVDEVLNAFEAHLAWLGEHGGLEQRRKRRLEQRLEDLLRDQVWRDFRGGVPEQAWREGIERLAARRATPHRVAGQLRERAAVGNGSDSQPASRRRR